MILPRLFQKLLLTPADVPPSRDDFEVVGAFNPGVVRAGDEVVMLVRVAERPREVRVGFTPLPRWDSDEGLTVDWTSDARLRPIDPRVVERVADGLVRLTFTSHLRVVRLGDGRSVRAVEPVRFLPEGPMEEFGVEDPRITEIDGRYYFTYVSVSRHGACTSLASTTDFRSFERHGVIFPSENKDVVLFPEKIGGAFAAIHRPNPATPFNRPEMWTASSPDLRRWGGHACLHGGGGAWETGRVGAGAPPVRVPDGWLEIYHGNRRPTKLGEVGAYSTGALLLAADDPSRVLARTTDSIMEPTADFERRGFVPDVVFATGIVESEAGWLVYYGAADSSSAVVEFAREDLLGALATV